MAINIKQAVKHFEGLLEGQINRLNKLCANQGQKDFKNLESIKIAIVPGDGIGPLISTATQAVLRKVLIDQLDSGKIHIQVIHGLTIENRLAQRVSIPADILHELKGCDLILKGPTTTPDKSQDSINLESANVVMRRELDLYANVRPIKVPEKGIDWIFFRENTEGLYALGPKGIDVIENGVEFSVDFRVISQFGSERIIRAACDFARQNGKKQVAVVTKANVVKYGDGRFVSTALKINKEEYPELSVQSYYSDIMAANLIDPKKQSNYQVIVAPNLYGDILTDEAAQIQGGVGTAGSANVGDRYAMFEAIHGSAPRMIQQGRSKFANPISLLLASTLMLKHIGYTEIAKKVEVAIDTTIKTRKKQITGYDDGCTTDEFIGCLLESL